MGGESYKTIHIKQRDISGSIRLIKAPLSPESEYAISVIRYVAYAISSAQKALDDASKKDALEKAYNIYVNLMSQYIETANLLKSQSLPPINAITKTSFLDTIYIFSAPNVLTEAPTSALTKVTRPESGLTKASAESEQNLANRIEIIKKGAEEAAQVQNGQIPVLGNVDFSRPVVISNPTIPSPFLPADNPALPVNYGFSQELIMRLPSQ
jgi:hypothetical protein